MIRPVRSSAVCFFKPTLCRGRIDDLSKQERLQEAGARLMSRNQKRDLALRREIKRQRLIVPATRDVESRGGYAGDMI